MTDYFDTIHCWFPIVSKKRMNMGHSLSEGGPDLALLFLAMKLAAQQPVNGVASVDSVVYIACKRFLALLESSGTISIIYLQAMMLVAIYEYGHAIYPAAWMTVAACSRYAEMLGLPSYRDSVVILRQAVSAPRRQRLAKLSRLTSSTGNLDRIGGAEESMVGDIHPRPRHLSREQATTCCPRAWPQRHSAHGRHCMGMCHLFLAAIRRYSQPTGRRRRSQCPPIRRLGSRD